MNVTDFKSKFASLARPNRFKVSGFTAGGLGEDLSFMCKAANLPAVTTGVVEVPYNGRVIKVAGDRTYEEWTVTIMVNKDFVTRKAFEDWANKINDPETNVGAGSHADYKADGMVEQLDATGQVLAAYNIVGAWPSLVSEVELSWDSNDTVSEFTVTFSYDYWTRSA